MHVHQDWVTHIISLKSTPKLPSEISRLQKGRTTCWSRLMVRLSAGHLLQLQKPQNTRTPTSKSGIQPSNCLLSSRVWADSKIQLNNLSPTVWPRSLSWRSLWTANPLSFLSISGLSMHCLFLLVLICRSRPRSWRTWLSNWAKRYFD